MQKKNGNQTDLSWSTLTESDNDKFVIERSPNQRDFSIILTVPVTESNSTILKNYKITDNKPLSGTNYYRLVQFDKDGTRNELGVRAVTFEKLTNVSIAAFPNPTNNKINFSIKNFNEGRLTIILIDAYGRMVHNENFDNAGNGNFTLSLKQKLPPGYYVLNVKADNFVQNLKIIVYNE